MLLAMATLFRCSEQAPHKKRAAENGAGIASGTQGGGSQGESKYGMTMQQVEELAVRTAQVLSLHDVRLRELSTMLRRVRLPVGSAYGKAMVDVDTKWKAVRKDGGKHEGSKHLRLAAVLLEMLYQTTQDGDETRKVLTERWSGKDTSTPEFLGTDVRVMKWRTLKNGKEGVLEFMMVPELAFVERELLRVLTGVQGAQEMFGLESKGPQIREVEEMIEGTWRRG